MEQQRERARAAGKFGGGTALPAELVAQLTPTEFLGYEQLEAGGLRSRRAAARRHVRSMRSTPATRPW